MRTLKGMGLETDEPFGKLYKAHEEITKISPHKVVAAALAGGKTGTDSADYGNFATGSYASTTDFRKELIKKTLKARLSVYFSLSIPVLKRVSAKKLAHWQFVSSKSCSSTRFTRSRRQSSNTRQARVLPRPWTSGGFFTLVLWRMERLLAKVPTSSLRSAMVSSVRI